MAYTPQTWTNGAAGGTPLSAARLAVIESGLQAAAAVADAAIPQTANASGDVTGTNLNLMIGAGKVTAAKIATGTITDTQVAAANKDGAAGTASMRTLGTSATQAAAGNDGRFTDTRTPTDATVTDAKIASTLSPSKITGTAVVQARQVIAGTGLTGGGDLSADVTLTAAFGTSIPARSTVAGTAGSTSTASKSDHAHPRTWFTAADHGGITQAYDVAAMAPNGTLLANAGEVNVIRLHIDTTATVTNIVMYVQNAGATLTSGQCLAALFDSSRNLLGTSGDQATAWQTTGTKTMALTPQSAGSLTNLAPGDYFVGVYANGTTMPGFLRGSSTGSYPNWGGLTGNTSRYATADTGRTTSFPTQLTTLVASSTSYWAGLS